MPNDVLVNEVLADLMVVIEWLVATKTPSPATKAALDRLRALVKQSADEK